LLYDTYAWLSRYITVNMQHHDFISRGSRFTVDTRTVLFGEMKRFGQVPCTALQTREDWWVSDVDDNAFVGWHLHVYAKP
jgi:hypothetical protein